MAIGGEHSDTRGVTTQGSRYTAAERLEKDKKTGSGLSGRAAEVGDFWREEPKAIIDA
jgi:hypothetical protein